MKLNGNRDKLYSVQQVAATAFDILLSDKLMLHNAEVFVTSVRVLTFTLRFANTSSITPALQSTMSFTVDLGTV